MVTCCAGCKGTACPTKDGTVQWESGSERTNGVDYWIAALARGAKPRLLGYSPPKTLEQMQAGIARKTRRRHARNR